MSVQHVQKIACDNAAGIVMNFNVAYINDDGDTLTFGDSGNYPIDQARTIDLGAAGVPDGAFIWPIVNGVAAGTVEAPKKVKYASNGNVATYVVTGVSFNFNVTLND